MEAVELSESELEHQIAQGHQGNYLVWRYLIGRASFDELMAYCWKIVQAHYLFVPQDRSEMLRQTALNNASQTRRELIQSSEIQPTREAIEIGILKYISKFRHMTAQQINDLALREELGGVGTASVNEVVNEI